jgi:hypothetical protein
VRLVSGAPVLDRDVRDDTRDAERRDESRYREQQAVVGQNRDVRLCRYACADG